MVNEPPRILYRLSQTDQLTLEVFMSHEALGIPPRRPLSRRERDRWRGVSHQATRESARVKGTESPWLGRYIVEVHIPPGAAVRVEQTGHDPFHYTVWAEPT